MPTKGFAPAPHPHPRPAPMRIPGGLSSTPLPPPSGPVPTPTLRKNRDDADSSAHQQVHPPQDPVLSGSNPAPTPSTANNPIVGPPALTPSSLTYTSAPVQSTPHPPQSELFPAPAEVAQASTMTSTPDHASSHPPSQDQPSLLSVSAPAPIPTQCRRRLHSPIPLLHSMQRVKRRKRG